MTNSPGNDLGRFESLLYAKSQKTRQSYVSRVRRFLGWCTAYHKGVNQYSAIEFVNSNYTSPASINVSFSALRSYLEFLGEDTKRMENVKGDSRPREHLSEDEVTELLRARKNTKNDVRNNLIMRLMLFCGMRINEVLSLRLSDFDLSTRRIRLHEGNTKGSTARINYYDPDTGRVLDLYTSRYPHRKKGLLFDIGDDEFNRELRDYLRIAGIDKNITSHNLRHTFAITYLQRKGDPAKLQKLMGHRDFSTTTIYLQYTDEELRKDYAGVFG